MFMLCVDDGHGEKWVRTNWEMGFWSKYSLTNSCDSCLVLMWGVLWAY